LSQVTPRQQEVTYAHLLNGAITALIQMLFFWENFFAKEPGPPTDYWITGLMKFLVSHMAGLKLRLLDRIVLPQESIFAVEPLSNQRTESNPMAVYQAVEDRICTQRDLASRTDLTGEQVLRAVRLLVKIVWKSDLPVDFFPGEIFLLTRGAQQRSCEETTAKREFRARSFLGWLGNANARPRQFSNLKIQCPQALFSVDLTRTGCVWPFPSSHGRRSTEPHHPSI
jgi:hypothetical protein